MKNGKIIEASFASVISSFGSRSPNHAAVNELFRECK